MRQIIIISGFAILFAISPTHAVMPVEQQNAVIYDPVEVVEQTYTDQVGYSGIIPEDQLQVPTSFEYDLSMLL